ncbi:sensor histidine kinase [Jeotgalibaca caeni]|uniref:sensor histidine kinase n=1 Tax=Jeotgalibaca caeni TaxID=3028623 RepID=UPI00237E5C08|nr:sensor histidine kinase [Jeotgalibaca caeni]MDE1549100.1 sensor histidine kinase [Jeotgalibaca caeni]
MKRWWERVQPKTIQRQLFLIYIGILFVPIALVGYYMIVEIRADQIQVKTEEIEQNTTRTAQELASTLESVIRVSDWIYQDERLATLVTRMYLNHYEVFEAYQNYQQFSDYLQYYKEIQHIRFYVDNPTLTNSVGIVPLTPEIRAENWYNEVISHQGQIVWRYLEDSITREWYLNLTRSVYQDGNLIGVLHVAVSNDVIRDMMAQTGNTLFLTLDDNLIFSHPDLNQIQGEYEQYRKLLDQTDESLHNQAGVESGVKGTEGNITFTVQLLDVPKSIHSEFKAVGTVPTATIVAQANQVFINAALVVLLVFFLSLILLIIFIRHFNQRVLQLKNSMTKVALGNFDISPTISGNDEITDVYDHLYLTMESLQKLLTERYQHELEQKNWEIQIKEAEFKLLSSQINPHFLYNTLEMIRMKALRNRDKEVADIVKILSKLMRKALERNNEELWLSEDLAFIEMYLQIQQLRFGERVQYRIDNWTQDDYTILPLLVQPLVENAFVHGLERIAGEARLAVQVEKAGTDLKIIIRDNGVGIPAERLAKLQKILDGHEETNGIGISNVHQRVKYFYGPEYGLQIESIEGEGTKVILNIPQRKRKRGERENDVSSTDRR